MTPTSRKYSGNSRQRRTQRRRQDRTARTPLHVCRSLSEFTVCFPVNTHCHDVDLWSDLRKEPRP